MPQGGSSLRRSFPLLSKKDKDSDYIQLRKHFNRFIEEWNDQSVYESLRYVIHRKITLSFLDRHFQARNEEKYPLEESVHKIIFPLRKTSDDVTAEEMNLWIIDERLAYHYFLASDKYLRQPRRFRFHRS